MSWIILVVILGRLLLLLVWLLITIFAVIIGLIEAVSTFIHLLLIEVLTTLFRAINCLFDR